jgi:hypothetical protein
MISLCEEHMRICVERRVYMDWQHDDIRQVPDSNSINKQQVPQRQEVPSPQQVPGAEVFLERPDIPD